MDKSLIINHIQNLYGFKNNSEFARFLGISPQALSNWKSRNTFDAHLIYTKCLKINPHWLLTGDGEMLKNDNETPQNTNKVDMVSEDTVENNSDSTEKPNTNYPNPANSEFVLDPIDDVSDLDENDPDVLMKLIVSKSKRINTQQAHIDTLMGIVKDSIREIKGLKIENKKLSMELSKYKNDSSIG